MPAEKLKILLTGTTDKLRVPCIFTAFIFLFSCFPMEAQGISREQVNDTILPYFSIYKDNFLITGIPLHTAVASETADAKYQISFKQLLTRNTLPFNTSLFLTYTQTAFWNLYTGSSPFAEINFNPGIGLGKPFFNDNDRLTGLAELKLEHESNGRDSIYSRTWNSLSLAYHTGLKGNMILSLKAWLPFRYKMDNPGLIDYIGYGEVNLAYDIKPDKLILDVNLRKGLNLDLKGAIRTRLLYRISGSTNQFIMLEWYNGYAESLISFEESRSMLRFGYVIKSADLDLLKKTANYLH